MKPTDVEIAAAEARSSERRITAPVAIAARYDRRVGRIVVSLTSGLELGFAPRDVQGLERARPADLDAIELSPSGLGLHFPKLDADVYLPALLEGVLGSGAWTAARMGRAGGASRSDAKQAAAQRNGRLGGRPPKARIAR